MKIRFLLAILGIGLLFSCDDFLRRKDPLLAEVGHKKLYLSDIRDYLPVKMHAKDSANLVHSYAESWVNNELLLAHAENNLSAKDMDVDRLLEDYKKSLLIYRYEQEYVRQKLDTTISESALKDFYDNNPGKFAVTLPIVKGLYIKMWKKTPYLDKVKKLYGSTDPDDLSQLDILCKQLAVRYENHSNEWIEFASLVQELPQTESYLSQFEVRNFNVEDAKFVYFISVRSVVADGNYPFDYVKKSIKELVLNQRKQILIKDLSKEIYKKGKKDNDFKLFTKSIQ